MAGSVDQLKAVLDAAGVSYKVFMTDQTIATAQEGAETGLGSLASMAPTFILSTETGYLAAIITGDRRLSYKKIKRQLGLKNVSLASQEEVKQVTGAQVGWVSLINQGMKTIIDAQLNTLGTVFGGCGAPNHTLQIAPRDLIAINQARVFDFTEPKETPAGRAAAFR